MPAMPFAPLPDPAVDRQRDHDRRCPERETLELAAAGAWRLLAKGSVLFVVIQVAASLAAG